jgi:hypothetical protein
MRFLAKPGASCKTHLFAGAVVWSAVGIMLAWRGGWHLLRIDDFSWWWLFVACLVGTFKGQMVFVRSASRSVERILSRGDGKCLGGFISLKNWGLIVAMILLGKLLRATPLHRGIVWSVYVAVGFALVVSSRVFWKAWIGYDGAV